MTEETQISTLALVTGAGRNGGLGLEICRQVAQQGITVLLTARNDAKAQAAAGILKQEGLDVRPYTLDVTDDTSVRGLAKQIEQRYDRLDILLNNAAGYADWTETASSADIPNAQKVFSTNLFGPWRIIQAFLPLLRKSPKGRIVNVCSGSGSHGDPVFGLATGPGSASYSISKAAFGALTSKFAAELKDTNILVNAVDPGLTATAPGMEAMGARPVSDGAKSIVWAALLPQDGPSGGFFRDGEPLPW